MPGWVSKEIISERERMLACCNISSPVASLDVEQFNDRVCPQSRPIQAGGQHGKLPRLQQQFLLAALNTQSARQYSDDLHCLALEIESLSALHAAGIHPEERIIDEVTHRHDGIAGVAALDQARLDILEIDARQR